MPSLTVPSRRRRQTQLSDDDGNDDYASDVSSSKRQRTDGEASSQAQSSPEPNSVPGPRRMTNGQTASTSYDGDQHQPGAIVRVALTDFVTYENAVFYPGPNLNMVIGPNGTGKSSLVCAICLGLGYSPKHLGRAGQVGEFVKHGRATATIEVELKARPEESENHVVRVRITKEGDKRKWWLNGNETSLKSVQALMKSFGIQVDNLCQFLPQDRVAEFAGLSPVELLHETQRAAAPEEMLAWHDELKALRAEEKTLQLQDEADKENMKNLEDRQDNLRADVERLQERKAIEEKVELLEQTVCFVEYRDARETFKKQKDRKDAIEKSLKNLEKEVAPTMQAVDQKQQYAAKIETVIKTRKKNVTDCERAADEAMRAIEALDGDIKKTTQAREAEESGDKTRKQDMQNIRSKIRNFEAALLNKPPEFDAQDWNGRIRDKEKIQRQAERDAKETKQKIEDVKIRGQTTAGNIRDAEIEIEALNSKKGKDLSKLQASSRDTAAAWKWIQENQDKFKDEVFGPPAVTCSVKDPRYAAVVESLFQANTMMAITCQSNDDYRTLMNHCTSNLNLADFYVKVQDRRLDDPAYQQGNHRMDISNDEIQQQFGFDAWAIDLLEGPDVVLAMLVNEFHIGKVGIALKDITEQQYKNIERTGQRGIKTFAVGHQTYQITHRPEYGPEATSTTTRKINQARYWTDRQVGNSDKQRAIEHKIREWRQDLDSMREEAGTLKEALAESKVMYQTAGDDMQQLKKDKNELQRALSQFEALPIKLAREKESLELKQAQGEELLDRLRDLSRKVDDLILKKFDLSLKYKATVGRLRTAHADLLEAEVRRLEAVSDIDSLKERNRGITERLEQQRRLAEQAKNAATEAKTTATKALQVCQAVMNEYPDQTEYFKTIDKDITLQDLLNDIEAEKAKLDFVQCGNSGAIKEFEKRQATIDTLASKIAASERRLASMAGRIQGVRDKWEPELDKLISQISDAFAYNFEQIGCAGEVGVHKDEDFDQWAIEIKVKFRESEELQLLDQHRQSGGERSVSTIFYLMALQALARAPFRVVDEINQGMDPRNERMVHGRMVEIACKEHTSQYFLITPKLLTGLKYDARMKVLLINSGEYMPQDHRKLTISNVIRTRRAIAV